MSILGFTGMEILWYFLAYAFLGWCVEVIYCTVVRGVVVNRGFLNGPVCPVYGFGMLLILMLLRVCGYQNVTDANAGVLFFGGMVLASAIEFFAGWMLMKLFHTRWWDYSMRPFNLGGYICLQFSIVWGLGSLLAIRILHAVVENAVLFFCGIRWLIPVLILLYLVFSVDLVITAITVAGLNRDLQELDEIRSKLRSVSDDLSEKIGNRALETDRLVGEGRVQAHLAKAEAKERIQEHSEALRKKAAAAERTYRTELEKKAEEIRSRLLKKNPVFRRLLHAYPTLRHLNYAETVEELKNIGRKGKKMFEQSIGKK